MKKMLLGVLAVMAAVVVVTGGQAPAAEATWLTDLPAAQAQARAEHKLVLIDFTGSDWCPACIRFQKEVLDSQKFQDYAAKNVVPVELDFPDKKPQSDALKRANAALQTSYKVEGFPTLVVLDQNGKEIGRQLGYDASGPKAFIAQLEKYKNGR